MSLALIIGTSIYAAIKTLGYSLFAKYLNWLYGTKNNIWKVGSIRTVMGIVLGVLHNGICLSVLNVTMGRSPLGGEDTALYFFLLILLRVLEWSIIVFFFYDRKLKKKGSLMLAILLGILCSFILDIPFILGVFVVASSIC